MADGWYDMTFHAVEELAEDGLDTADLEAAVAEGEIIATEPDDLRGTRYTVDGPSRDRSRRVGVVGRFTETGIFLVITAYEVTPHDE
jgi:hypothetical protein